MTMRIRFAVCAALVALAALVGGSRPALAQAPSFLLQWGSQGTGPGQFTAIYAIGAAPNGNVYTADGANARIQVFTPDGEYITEWGSWGTADGQLRGPNALAFDAAGDVYVADTGNHRIQKFSPSGTFLGKWGVAGYDPGQMRNPRALAIDATGNVYVGCGGKDGVGRFTTDGVFINEWLNAYSGRLGNVYGLAVDAAGNLYAAHAGDGWIHVDEFTPTGTPLARFGSLDWSSLLSAAVNGADEVYLMHFGLNQVYVYSPAGELSATIGSRGTGPGQFRSPSGIALNSAGELYVGDAGNYRVQKFSPTAATPSRVDTWGRLKSLYR